MKHSAILLLFLCALPLSAFGHPGKTDRQGGHMCLKGCEDWGLFYEEYHLHDKDGRPIRLPRTKKAKQPELPLIAEQESKATETIAQERAIAEEQKVSIAYVDRIVNVYEESEPPLHPLIYVLLILLVLLLVLRMNRKRGTD